MQKDRAIRINLVWISTVKLIFDSQIFKFQ
jgi:hypothetical protein